MAEFPKLVTLHAAVRLLKEAGIEVSYESLRRSIASGQLKGKKLGRYWLISEDDLCEFVTPTTQDSWEGYGPRGGAGSAAEEQVDYAAMIDVLAKSHRAKAKKAK